MVGSGKGKTSAPAILSSPGIATALAFLWRLLHRPQAMAVRVPVEVVSQGKERWLVLALLALAGSFLLGQQGIIPRTQADQPALGSDEQTLLNIINDYRIGNGLQPFAPSPILVAAAQWMAQDIASRDYFGHTDSLGRDPQQRLAAFGYDYDTWSREILVAGSSDPQVIFNLWLNSPGYKAAILESQHSIVGIARAVQDGSASKWYWVLEVSSQDAVNAEPDDVTEPENFDPGVLVSANLSSSSPTLTASWSGISSSGPAASSSETLQLSTALIKPRRPPIRNVAPRPTPRPAPPATPTPSPTPTATPSPTATPPPTPTPTPTPSPAATPTPSASPTPPSPFVSAQGMALYLNGQPFRFVGVNRYNLLTIDPPDAPYRGCGDSWSDAELVQWFSEVQQMGVTAVRFWAFQLFTASGTDFSRMDRLIGLADRYGVKLIPVLENQWIECTVGGYKGNTWYQSGYLSPYGGYPISYKDYVGKVVSRYKDSPAILMWQLMNEAESTDHDALYRFTADISTLIKSIDRNHLVSLGTIGTGQPGAQGSEEYRHLHSIPSIDILEYHDYDPTQVFPSDGWNRLKERLEDAAALGKPLFVGESGISLTDYSADQRAGIFDAKMEAAFNNGVTGYLVWIYRDARSTNDPYSFNFQDPVTAIVKKYSAY